MAGSFMARFDAGSSGEGVVPPSAVGAVFVLAGIQFSGWGVVPGRCSAPARKRGAGAVAAAWISGLAGMTGIGEGAFPAFAGGRPFETAAVAASSG
jgi:hypothetical protein